MELNKTKTLERIYFILWIAFTILFIIAFIGIFLPLIFESEIYLGLSGVFASFASATVIAWVVERKTNKDAFQRTHKIRNFYLIDTLSHIKEFLTFISNNKENYNGLIKSYFIEGKLCYENLKYNMNFLFQMQFFIKTKGLQHYYCEEIIEGNDKAKSIISTHFVLRLVDGIIKAIMTTKEKLTILTKEIAIQNALNDNEIFSQNEVSLLNNLLTAIQDDESSYILLGYVNYDSFFDELQKTVNHFEIVIKEGTIAEVISSLLNSLSSIPLVHNKFYNSQKNIRDDAQNYINEVFILWKKQKKNKFRKSLLHPRLRQKENKKLKQNWRKISVSNLLK